MITALCVVVKLQRLSNVASFTSQQRLNLEMVGGVGGAEGAFMTFVKVTVPQAFAARSLLGLEMQ